MPLRRDRARDLPRHPPALDEVHQAARGGPFGAVPTRSRPLVLEIQGESCKLLVQSLFVYVCETWALGLVSLLYFYNIQSVREFK